MTTITDRAAIEALIDSLIGHRAIISYTDTYRPELPTITDTVVDGDEIDGLTDYDVVDLGSVVVIRGTQSYSHTGSVDIITITIFR